MKARYTPFPHPRPVVCTRRLGDFARRVSLVHRYVTLVPFTKSNLASTMAAAMVAIYRTLEFTEVALQITLPWRLSRGAMRNIYAGFSVSTGGGEIGTRPTRRSGGLLNRD
jgi:hypothetical protein